jgi:hypothetical protein
MLFKKNNTVTVTEISLKKEYAFMYENFIVASQQKLYLLLEQSNEIIDALQFDILIFKFGYPNDEVSHPYAKFGLGAYGLFEVKNSPWVTELKENNSQHHRHAESLFDNYKHYVARFKDVTVEAICRQMEEVQLTKADFLAFVDEQISYLKP